MVTTKIKVSIRRFFGDVQRQNVQPRLPLPDQPLVRLKLRDQQRKSFDLDREILDVDAEEIVELDPGPRIVVEPLDDDGLDLSHLLVRDDEEIAGVASGVEHA